MRREELRQIELERCEHAVHRDAHEPERHHSQLGRERQTERKRDADRAPSEVGEVHPAAAELEGERSSEQRSDEASAVEEGERASDERGRDRWTTGTG